MACWTRLPPRPAAGLSRARGSIWCCRRFPATASPISRPSSAGTPAAPRVPRRLGYTRYVAQGGDVGAVITDNMGRLAPAGLLGIHMNLLVPALGGAPMPTNTDEERAAAADDRLRPAGLPRRPGGLDAGSRHRQLLQDLPRLPRRTPVGQPHPRPHPRQHHALLADRHRRLGRPLVLGELPGSPPRRRAGPSARHPPGRVQRLPGRDLPGPRSWVQLGYPTLRYYNKPARGGHFAAWEEPQLFSEELRAAFRSLR
jgi:hypothetical protein